jgi:hypothetical protein
LLALLLASGDAQRERNSTTGCKQRSLARVCDHCVWLQQEIAWFHNESPL